MSEKHKNDTIQKPENDEIISLVKETEGTIEDALESTGLGRFNIWIIVTTGLVIFTVNIDVWTIGYVVPIAECDLKLSLMQKTILVTSGSVGMITTQYFWGYLSDKVGRRNVMLYAIAGGCICTIISALMPNFWLMTLFKFLNGTASACASGLTFAYIGEFFSAQYRSVAISIMAIFVGLGMTAVPALGWLIIPNQFSTLWFGTNIASWRVFLFITGLPAIPAWVFLYFAPESPKFLASVQRNEELLQLVHKIRRINRTKETKIIQKIKIEETNNQTVRIWELFHLKYLAKTLLVCTLQAGSYATCGGLMLWYPDFLKKISKSTEEVTICEAFNHPVPSFLTNGTTTNSIKGCELTLDSSVYFQNILIGLATTFGYVSLSGLIKFVGVKNLLIALLGFAGVATFSLYFITTAGVIDLLFIILLATTALCVVIINTATVEIYTTNMRGMAVCLVMLSGRMGVISAAFLIGYLLRWNCDVTFMLFAAGLISWSLLSILLPIKRK